jgi:arsenate reductase
MAEGWAHALRGNDFEAYSAGIETHGLNPRAVLAMAEVGVDISHHKSKLLSAFDFPFDIVVTVCGHAHESCPLFPGKTALLHAGFEDPPQLSKNAKTDADALPHYRRVRDEIRNFVAALELPA